MMYLKSLRRFIHRSACVLEVCVSAHTHTAQQTLVLQTEELQLLPVNAALHLLLLAPVLQEDLAQVPQSAVTRRTIHAGVRPAHGTSPGRAVFPVLIHTGPAEAVGAQQENGISEDVPAHRTQEVLLEVRRSGGHLSSVVFLS